VGFGMNLSGSTQPYAVLGHPIRHSLSPLMHNASLHSLGLDAVYVAFDVHPDYLMEVLPAMRRMGFGGVNLTVPLKEVAFRGLDDLDDLARRLGAVNTIEFLEDGQLRGHNTDGYGILKALDEGFGLSPAGKCIFILGCGGAGRAAALTCAEEGAQRLLLANRTQARAERLAEEARSEFPACEVDVVDAADWTSACAGADLVIQCSTVGMHAQDSSTLPMAAFRPGQAIFDMIYMFPETKLLETAREAGASISNGLGMLLHQGARSFEIWSGQQADTEAMRTALESAVYTDRASA
jgi:shikimate dehydrogenase